MNPPNIPGTQSPAPGAQQMPPAASRVLDAEKIDEIRQLGPTKGELLARAGTPLPGERGHAAGCESVSQAGLTPEQLGQIVRVLYGDENALYVFGYLPKWLQDFETSDDAERRLSALRYISQHCRYLDADMMERLLALARQDADKRVRGEACYALGRYGDPVMAHALAPFISDPDEYVKRKATQALSRLSEQWQESVVQPGSSALRTVTQQVQALAKEVVALRNAIEASQVGLEPFSDAVSETALAEAARNEAAYEQACVDLALMRPGQFIVLTDGETLAVHSDEAEAVEEALRKRPDAHLYIRQLRGAPSRPAREAP